MNPVEILSLIKGRLTPGDPQAVAGETMASVAVLLRQESSLEALMIKRAERDRDPWSGQVAFPGGRREPQDRSLLGTAVRETREELGMNLAESASYLGHFGNFRTHTGTMLVSACAFLQRRPEQPTPNSEVASYRWVPLDTFLKKEARTSYNLRRGGTTQRMPAYKYEDFVIWGLTYRMISAMLGRK